MAWQNSPRINSIGKSLGVFLLGSLVFTLAYAQAPVYFSNQNQYFVHGLAAAGYGSLDRDWLANTGDPTPVFSALVAGTYSLFGEDSFLNFGQNLFYVYYGLLIGVYFFSLMGLFNVLAGDRATSLARLIFIAFLLLLHSAVLRCLSARLLGTDYPWYFQAGLAGQYVLGPMLQPSTFGVLLLASLYFFVCGKPFLAVACSSLGAVCHSTYLLPAAMLTIAYLSVLLYERQVRKAFLVGGLALLMVLPVVVYNWLMFRPTSLEAFAEAKEILVHFRIPHHTIPALWLDGIALAQIGWLVLGIALAWRTRLFPVLLITFLLGLALSLVQVATASDALALLFPWRISVILLPAATAIILTRLVMLVARKGDGSRLSEGPEGRCTQSTPVPFSGRKLAWGICTLLIAGLAAGGVAIMYSGQAFQTRDEELAMMEFVYRDQSPEDIYLLPVPVPNLKATVRGSFKSDFKPLKALQKSSQFIPVDLLRFRLYTGAPIFVDFKSIPYQDADVLEWKERLHLNQEFYEGLKKGNYTEVLPRLREQKITHLLLPAHEELDESVFSLLYHDDFYRIYLVPDP